MKPRVKVSIVSAAEDGAPAPVDTPAPVAGRFHAMLIVEEVQTGDKRLFAANSITWPEDTTAVQIPLTADDENHEYHLDAKLVGNFDTIERRGAEIHGWGAYIENPDEDAARLIGLIQSGELRGISVDVDAYEFEILFPTTGTEDPVLDELMGEDVPPAPTEDIDGVEYEVFPIEQPIERVTQGRIRGACALLFPAFIESFIEPDGAPAAVAASAHPAMASCSLTGLMVDPLCDGETEPFIGVFNGSPVAVVADAGRFQFPEIPPRHWFEVEEPDVPMALTILDSGQVMGHLGEWGVCHIGITGECVDPPPSPTNYARFHLGEIPVDDGGRVQVGHLTFHSGHAKRDWDAPTTIRHYDDSGKVAADLRAANGRFGVWVCGAMRPNVTTADVREIMSCPPSGDWRPFGNELDMVAALAVPVPGFQNLHGRTYVRKNELGMVASMIWANPVADTRFVGPQTVAPDTARRIGDLIATSIGRSKKQRVAELSARVHGG